MIGVALLIATGASTAADFTHLPAVPVADKTIALRIDDITVVGGNVVGPHKVSVAGASVRIDGCLGTRGIPTFATPAVTVTLMLPAGSYTIDYHRSISGAEHCAIGDGVPVQRVGATTLTVAPAGTATLPAPVAAVYEYRHTTFGTGDYGHYFMTAVEDEKLALETGRFSNWGRDRPTPRTEAASGFGFFTSPATDRIPLCRFFTVAFAPVSSHFYTTDANECETLKQSPVWLYEGVVGYVWPAQRDGTCSQGRPLYRMYNGGRTGAPNHFYTESEQLRSARLGIGWIAEGAGPGVIACVPPRP